MPSPTRGPGANHFSRDSWFLELKNMVVEAKIGVLGGYHYWSVIAAMPFPQTEPRNVLSVSASVFVVYTHTEFILIPPIPFSTTGFILVSLFI